VGWDAESPSAHGHASAQALGVDEKSVSRDHAVCRGRIRWKSAANQAVEAAQLAQITANR